MPFINASMELPDRFIAVARDERTLTESLQLADTPLTTVADRYGDRRPMLEQSVAFVSTGAWEMFALDPGVPGIENGGQMIQVWVWKDYCGQTVNELANALVGLRQRASGVEQVIIDNVELRHGTATRTRYVEPDGFLTAGPWIWVEYVIVVDRRAFGVAMQAPIEEQDEALRSFAEIAETFMVEPLLAHTR